METTKRRIDESLLFAADSCTGRWIHKLYGSHRAMISPRQRAAINARYMKSTPGVPAMRVPHYKLIQVAHIKSDRAGRSELYRTVSNFPKLAGLLLYASLKELDFDGRFSEGYFNLDF